MVLEEKGNYVGNVRFLMFFISVEKQDYKSEILEYLAEKTMNTEIFEKVKSIVVEQLEVDYELVIPEANIMFDLGADDQDALELIMALEEEFDIEISDKFLGCSWSWESTCPDSRLNPITVEEIVDLVSQTIELN